MFNSTVNKRIIMEQTTNNILMIRPSNFNYNVQTAVNNYYQKDGIEIDLVNENAQKEFDLLVDKLKSNGINVMVFDDDLNMILQIPYSQTIGLHFIQMEM